MCFLSTTFPNAPAHPPLYFLTSPLIIYLNLCHSHSQENHKISHTGIAKEFTEKCDVHSQPVHKLSARGLWASLGAGEKKGDRACSHVLRN